MKTLNKIYRPIRTNRRSQAFGENKACINKQNKVVTKRTFVCPSGYEDLYKSFGLDGHNGEDWATWYGEPVRFSTLGNIKWKAKTEVDMDGGIGVDVISTEEVFVPESKGLINNFSKDGVNGYYGYIKFRFWHLKKVNVYDGQYIKANDTIGYADSTGLSSGNHVHWSAKMCNQIGQGVKGYNGYSGAFDFSKFFSNRFITDVVEGRLSTLRKIMDLLYRIKSMLKYI